MEVKAQEYVTLKVPYEILNKRFRSAQKTIDREFHGVAGALTDLERCIESGDATAGTVVSLLDGVVAKLNSMKRKAVDAIELEEQSARLCKRRVQHLKEHANSSPEVATHWKKTRFDRMVVDHLLRSGFYNSAIKLAKESNIEDLVNIDVFVTAWEVEKALEICDSSRCLAWCHDNRSRLRKLKSNLEFSLRVQEFVELVRNDQRVEAIRHARKYFAIAEGPQLDEVKQVMGLLAFPIDTHVSPYKELLSQLRWQELKEQFRYENYRLHQLSDVSVFKVTLQSGLSALKTHQCYREESKNPDCPVCNSTFNKLAESLPYAHCTQSRLICGITGKVMNENNPPLMLPNGHVYGERGLQSIAKHGNICCPRTKEEVSQNRVEKVYVM